MRYYYLFLHILFTISLLSFQSCGYFLSSRGNDKQDEGSFLSSILLGQCSIGGQNFSVAGGIICTNGSASGSGSLTAISDGRDDHGMQAIFSLNAIDSQIDFVAAGNRADLASTGHGFKFTLTSVNAHGPGGLPFSPNIAALVPVINAQKTVCMEIHSLEADVHMVIDDRPCPPGQQDMTSPPVTYESGGVLTNGAKNGQGWGIINIRNAVLFSLNVRSQRIYCEAGQTSC